MNCSSLAKASLQSYWGMILQVSTKADYSRERVDDDEEDDDGSKNVGTRLGWRDGCVGRRLWKATDGRRRLYTRYTILPPNHHHHLLMPSYATLSSSKTISCRDCGHEGRPALCDLIAAWSATYYVTRHLRSCSAFNRYSMPDNLRVCPGSSVVLRTNSSRD